MNALIQMPSAPNCGTKAIIRSTIPMISKVIASLTTIFSTSVACEYPLAETLSPSSRRSLKPIRRLAASAKKLVRVTRPRPPTWISSKTTACPKGVNCVQVSRTTRPVTQVALVAVNMASTTPSRPLRLEMGSVSSSVPSAISSTKLMQMTCVALLPSSQPRRRGALFFRFIPISWLLFVPGRLCCTCTSFCTHAAHEYLSYRIHLFSFRFNLILWGSCGIIIWYSSS